ncbi:4-(cytidine 5'-diphospho)-2-C-methyl-D-erythritol kinase [Profundibacter amoris]|uniref:4-diphosphocytidyl-2-C-methyl-D-erythritol kinase n=1 Tax=Profundibacter amoris TaxID=2171755 RepID=A0A347UD75_9RHOB|nr:4-(cytidine 5'-diphospho)-2-C-methyl-D-erythritol kinase [Profundibacter amoris]AXX96803.1 4-(cytidine 5'-diphospho)-2-C-methyl-D-erythritol kinase [Profundibacter amoris]
MAIRVFAPAKVNLTLHVTGQRADGYHLLDSLVVFADVGDVVTAVDGAGLTLDVTGPEAGDVPSGESNSILQAARFLGVDDVAFSLEKHLPTAAGIGGGTADASATLQAVAQLRGVDIPADVLPLGADVPVCLRGCATRMSGIGEELADVDGLPDIWAVLVNPRVGVSTPEVFKRLQSKDNRPMPDEIPAFETVRDLAGWLAEQRNDLEAAAIEVQPKVAEVLSVLQQAVGQLLTRMSGSGATCFAIFSDEKSAKGAAQEISTQHPDWWVRNTRLGGKNL